MQDAVTASSNPAIAVNPDALKLTDVVSAQLDTLEANLTESARITDSVTVLSGLAVSVSESVRIAESVPVGRLNPTVSSPKASIGPPGWLNSGPVSRYRAAPGR